MVGDGRAGGEPDPVSSATIHPDARSACRAQLNATPGLPAAHAYEGFAYQPVLGTPFVEDELIGNFDTPRANRAIEHNVSYIITLKYPANVGTADIEVMAGALLDRFKVGTTLTHGSSTVLCLAAQRRGKIVEGPEWLTLAVMVTLTAFTLE